MCIESVRRSTGDGFFVTLTTSSEIIRYSSYSSMVTNTKDKELIRSAEYPDLPATIRDMHFVEQPDNEYLVVIRGKLF